MQKVKGISGSTLKIIAVISMLIDHTAAVLLDPVFLKFGYTQELHIVYIIMRYFIGRMAFPIYCFLLVEGFEKTRSRLRYAGRLFAFALISEIPFNLAFKGSISDFSYQNVFFTLFLGFLTIWGMAELEKVKTALVLKAAGMGIVFLAAAFAAERLYCDYGTHGIIAVTLLFLFRKNKVTQIIAGCVAFLWEITAPFAFVFVGFYNGKRGLKLKYVFYLFYPLHLLVLYFTALLLLS